MGYDGFLIFSFPFLEAPPPPWSSQGFFFWPPLKRCWFIKGKYHSPPPPSTQVQHVKLTLCHIKVLWQAYWALLVINIEKCYHWTLIYHSLSPSATIFIFYSTQEQQLSAEKCPILMLQNDFICMTTVGCKNTQIVQKHVQEWTVHIITSSLMLSHLWWENMNEFLGAKLQYNCRCAWVFTFFETEINILVQTKIHRSRNQIQQNVLS